ncbi:helix-turn-helix domain-containing protein [Massilia sp. YIM B02443]|uniref:helix-turn-helix domain-containing protein n=1 Tax=Massilia sp. YIM B02443 TaxID=3050127 RepID=UPI0025B66775|nr:helix-turn-helix domain-containing protein [Massilia sp. YIM B02443]MDN4035842.1 helix-turn-helix domain-containing protein [Massilia sp. YIM B02443]
MDIAEVAKKTGVPASTLRYYEKRGLIASSGRHGLRRRFTDDVLERLALIALGQAAGLSLEEIQAMLAQGGDPAIDRAMLAAKADEIDALVLRLRTMSKGLRHAAACRAPSHMACPTFRKLMASAGSGALERRWRGTELPKPVAGKL